MGGEDCECGAGDDVACDVALDGDGEESSSIAMSGDSALTRTDADPDATLGDGRGADANAGVQGGIASSAPQDIRSKLLSRYSPFHSLILICLHLGVTIVNLYEFNSEHLLPCLVKEDMNAHFDKNFQTVDATPAIVFFHSLPPGSVAPFLLSGLYSAYGIPWSPPRLTPGTRGSSPSTSTP